MVEKICVRKSKLLLLIVLVAFIVLSSSVLSESCNSNKIALLGDSITVGWGPEFIQSCADQPVNYAVGGTETAWMLDKLKSNILGKGNTHLIVLGGTNDITNGKSSTDIILNLEQIYFLARQDNIKVIAGTIPPYNRQSKADKNNIAEEVNDWIRSQKELGNIDAIVDFYQLLVGVEPCMNSLYADSCNNVHPNNAGYASMASKVFNDVFVGQTTAGTSLSTSASLQEFTTMVILGRHIRSEMENRVSGGYGLIKAGGNFNKLILTGGCVAAASDATCQTCNGCNEADEMEKYLLEIGSNDLIKLPSGNLQYLDSLGSIREITVIKEGKSVSTADNLKKSKGFIQPKEKVLVVSDHKHVRPFAYCLRYNEPGADAYYFHLKDSSYPEVPSTTLPGTSLDYRMMAQGCSTNLIPQPTQSPQYSQSPQQQTQQPTQQQEPQYTTTKVPKNLPQRQKEIDEVWYLKIGELVRDSSEIWDTTTKTWQQFDDVYYTIKQVQTYSSQTITRGGQTTGTGAVPSIQGDLTTPLYDCSGITKLPTAERQEGIASIGYNSNGKSREQIIVEQANLYKVHPAVIATHATLETNIGRGASLAKNDYSGSAYCIDPAGSKRSKLTGCGWAVKYVKVCDSPYESTHSDEGQLSCTAKRYDNFESLSGSYAKCNSLPGIQKWKCLQCVYVGSYNKPYEGSVDQRFFIQDGTCKYAENFKNIYCQWNNYFDQKNIAVGQTSNLQASTTTVEQVPFNPASGSFTFVVASDFHNGFGVKDSLLASIKSVNPAFVIFNGDTVNSNSGDYKKTWTKFFDQIVNPLASVGIPTFASLGNHDTEGKSERKAHFNQIWKSHYQSNSQLYQPFENFNYNNVPVHLFDFLGKRFFILDHNSGEIDSSQLTNLQNNIQPGSFVLAHGALANVRGAKCTAADPKSQNCDKYGGRKMGSSSRAKVAQLIDQTDSLFISGHLHYFYQAYYLGENSEFQSPVVFVGTAKTSDNRGIIKTYYNPTVQPASFVVFEVGTQVKVTNYIKDGNTFRPFTSADATQYFPSTSELAQLGQASRFSPVSVGSPILG